MIHNMLTVLLVLLVVNKVNLEVTTYDWRHHDYRLTRLEVSTAEQISKLQKDLKEALAEQRKYQTFIPILTSGTSFFREKNILNQEKTFLDIEENLRDIKNISLNCINNKVLENQRHTTFVIEDLVKAIDTRTNKIENTLSHIQDFIKNSNYSELYDTIHPKHCANLSNKTSNGVYKIKPGKETIYAYCDMETDGGGWTVIQSRKSEDTDFYNGWNDYKKGFGNLLGDFWLGLETMYQLTNDELNELLIELEDFDDKKKVAKYSTFAIGTEEEGYPIKILGSYSGNAGDSLAYHAGSKFTTKDKDQDALKGNCAEAYIGAWWYKECHRSNLNGKYLRGTVTGPNLAKGMCWYGFRGHEYSLKTSRMLLRPVSYNK